MNRPKQSDILPEPLQDLKQHSDCLLQRILARINENGPISFAQYMEMALYEPGLGYYSAGLHKFGPEGDFITAPELGDVFAACMARQAIEVATELGSCNILEIGAGSGKLAAQIMAELSGIDLPDRGRSYKILETSADLRAVQRRTIQEDAGWSVTWLDHPPRESWQGIIIANEVIDALPVERFLIADGEVRQICVNAEDGVLTLDQRTAPVELQEAVSGLGELPNNYCSEINLLMPAWLDAITSGLEKGVAIFVDYGYPRNEFYLPERSDGTLIAHYRHRAHDNVLRYPGLQDLTAFVDFSAVARAGRAANLDLLGYTSQALFLMGSGLDEVVHNRLSGDTGQDMDVNNEVRHLMLPELMGEKFQVMAFGRDWPKEKTLRGFSFRDLQNRL